MFGHQSFSELPLSTVLFRIFVTPTGVSITATVDSSFVGVSGSAGIVVDTISSASADFFDESTVQAASGASAARAQFGISVELGNMVSILNGGGILTNMQGVSGNTEIGQVLVWGNIEISQDPSYTKITPNQTASYSQVQPSQTPSFSKVTPSQTPSYSLVTPNQTPTWSS